MLAIMRPGQRFKSFLDSVRAKASHPSYPLWVAGLAMLDIFIGVIPTDALAISGVLARPRRWLLIAMAASLGSVLGASILGWIIAYDVHLIVDFLPALFNSTAWAQTQKFFDHYGDFAISIGVMGPFPLQPFIILPILAGVSFGSWFVSFSTARVAKFTVLCYLASHAPGLLNYLMRKLWIFGRDIKKDPVTLHEIEDKKDEHLLG